MKTICNEIDFVRELAEIWKDKESSFVFYGKFIGHSHPLCKDWKEFAKSDKKYSDAYCLKSDPVLRDFRKILNKEGKRVVALVVNPGGEVNSGNGREIHAQCLVIFKEKEGRGG